MSKAIDKLDSVTKKLFLFLGSISEGMTEEDFREMESMGMKPNRELIAKARDAYHSSLRQPMAA